MKDFAAIDFEIANSERCSVCSVGIVIYRDGKKVDEFYCTLKKSREVWPEGRHNLDIIAERCGYNLENHHHALADAEACARIAVEIL